MTSRHVILILVCLAAPSCAVPRIFTQKVPAPVLKSDAQVEHERAAADLIAQKIETPVELKPVAIVLSASLGTPKRSLVDVKEFSLPTAARQSTTDLNASLVDIQHRLDLTNARLARLQGKEIEGTGISLLGPGMVTIVIALIALGVIFPPAFTILFMLFRRLRETAAHIVTSIDEVSKDPTTKDAITKLKGRLQDVTDRTHREVIHTLQKP